jgi:hypothetical protein
MTETTTPELAQLADALAALVEPDPARHFVLVILTDNGDETTHVEVTSDLAPDVANEVLGAFIDDRRAESARINGHAH